MTNITDFENEYHEYGDIIMIIDEPDNQLSLDHFLGDKLMSTADLLPWLKTLN